MALSQTLAQTQLQKLSPQQIQGIKLLELPTLQLEARIAREIEENPVLEEEQRKENDEGEITKSDTSSIEEYIRAEEASPAYRMRANNTSADDDSRPRQISGGKTLADFLLEQLSFMHLSTRQMNIASFIVGTIDDDGYLHRSSESIADDIAFKLALDVTTDQVEQVIAIVQQLEPAGIAARSLAECLLLQIDALRTKSKAVELAKKILKNYFSEFSKRHFAVIMNKLGVTEDELREAIEVVTSLNPKPANGYSDDGSASNSPVIVPDFTLNYRDADDEFDLEMAGRPLPELKINRNYLKMAEQALASKERTTADREALEFVKSKIDSAKWFISAIKQRRQTLITTMKAILEFQRDYFVDGDQSLLRPMILRDIAERTGFDISTISRVVNSKYIETHFGTFQLKYFFSEGLATDSGEEVSTREIKRLIAEWIENESKRDPLTDEALMQMLHDKGFQIARRTVAKYRELMNIPVARLRREL